MVDGSQLVVAGQQRKATQGTAGAISAVAHQSLWFLPSFVFSGWVKEIKMTESSVLMMLFFRFSEGKGRLAPKEFIGVYSSYYNVRHLQLSAP